MRSGLRGALRLALDIALPTLCPSCREPLGHGVGLCATCWSKLSFIEKPYCARLGIPFVYDPGPGLLSMDAIADPPAYDRARAAVRYDDVARALVVAFKFSDRLDLAPMMGRWMARAGSELLADADALLPVPLHWRRLWARRINQAAALAKAISEVSGVPVLHGGINRVRATQQQVGLSKSERAATCRAPSGSRPSARPKSPAKGWCWWTTYSPRAPRSIPAPGRCCGPALPMSTCWSSPGLSRPCAAPYKLV
jgi:predicted amidophosphoribosyltransferase